MVVSQRIPDNQIRVFNRPIVFRVGRQSGVDLALIGVLAGGIQLLSIVGSHPEMFAHVARSPADIGIRVLERRRILPGSQLIGNGFAEAI